MYIHYFARMHRIRFWYFRIIIKFAVVVWGRQLLPYTRYTVCVELELIVFARFTLARLLPKPSNSMTSPHSAYVSMGLSTTHLGYSFLSLGWSAAIDKSILWIGRYPSAIATPQPETQHYTTARAAWLWNPCCTSFYALPLHHTSCTNHQWQQYPC